MLFIFFTESLSFNHLFKGHTKHILTRIILLYRFFTWIHMYNISKTAISLTDFTEYKLINIMYQHINISSNISAFELIKYVWRDIYHIDSSGLYYLPK